VTFKTAGSRSITATDTANAALTATQTASVTPAAFSNLNLNGYPSPTVAGVAQSFTVYARDAYTNFVTTYTGMVHFTSTDPKAILPPDYTFTTADKGIHTFTGVALETAGGQHITVADVSAGVSSTYGFGVTPAAASSLTITGYPSPVSAGTAHNFVVTLYDAYGNIATGYTGTIHFTSSDILALVPPDYVFTSADAGKHTFSATFNTKGTVSLTATDKSSSSITGSQTGIQVQ
jgi:hypothetical protein